MPLYLRWRYRAATCMRGAISRRRVAARPITSPNGTGAIGRRSVRGYTALCGRWPCRAATCMRGAISRRRAAARPTTSPNGTGAVGRRSGSGMDSHRCMRWRCRAATCMRGAISRRRAAVAANQHRQMEREHLVGAGFGDGRLWPCVCAGGVGQRRVCGRRFHDGGRQSRPTTSPNGTGAVGRRSARG